MEKMEVGLPTAALLAQAGITSEVSAYAAHLGAHVLATAGDPVHYYGTMWTATSSAAPTAPGATTLTQRHEHPAADRRVAVSPLIKNPHQGGFGYTEMFLGTPVLTWGQEMVYYPQSAVSPALGEVLDQALRVRPWQYPAAKKLTTFALPPRRTGLTEKLKNCFLAEPLNRNYSFTFGNRNYLAVAEPENERNVWFRCDPVRVVPTDEGYICTPALFPAAYHETGIHLTWRGSSLLRYLNTQFLTDLTNSVILNHAPAQIAENMAGLAYLG